MTRRSINFILLPALLTSNLTFAQEQYELKPLERISLASSIDDFDSSLSSPKASILVNNGAELYLDDFVLLVKNNHPNILGAKLSREIASFKHLETQGAFDPSVNSNNAFRRFNSSSAPGDSQEAFTSDTSLDFLTPYGSKFGLGAKFAQGDIKSPVKPTGEAGEYYVKAVIPFMRDAVYNSKSVKEKTAKLNEIIADYELFQTKIKTLSSAIDTYWDWFATKKILDVERDLLNLVNNQIGFVKEQAKSGNLPQIVVTEAEREAQKRKLKVKTALREFQRTSLEISHFLWTEEGVPYSIPNIDQVSGKFPTPRLLEELDITAAKLTALTNRPEFKTLDLSREISELEQKLAQNQMMPQLDAYISSGVQAGADSVSPTLEAGLNISLPLRVRTAKGQKKQAELKIQTLNLKERQLVQAIFLDVEDAASQVNTAYERFLAAKQDFSLSKKLEEGERSKFELGDSTLFLVIRRQRARVEANISLLKVIKDYQKARAKFTLAQGSLI